MRARPSVRAAAAALVVASALPLLAACATVPDARADQCIVSTRYLLGPGRFAEVKAGEARVPSLLGDRVVASRLSDGAFRYHVAVLGDVQSALYQERRLVMKNLGVQYRSEPIEDGELTIKLPLQEKRFSYSSACDESDAALGAWAILKTEEEDTMATAAAL